MRPLLPLRSILRGSSVINMSWQILLTVLTASVLTHFNAAAQSIEVGQLGSAEAYDVGTLDPSRGGLDQNLWNRTSAPRAVRLLKQAPVQSRDPLVRDLIRAAVLSGGVPPRAADPAMETAFKTARIETIITMGEMGAAQEIIARTPVLSRNNLLQVGMHLRAGNDEAACAVADTVLEDRAAPKWARLRAYCHVVRDEIAAAELTTDVLRSSDYKDPSYFSLMNRISGGVGKPDFKSLSANDSLHIALMSRAALDWPKDRPQTASARIALSPLAAPDDRLVALYAAGPALSDAQIRSVMTGLAASQEDDLAGDDLAGGVVPGYASAVAADVPKGTAQLFELAQSGSQEDRPQAMAELLKRAKGAGALDRFAALMGASIQTLSPEEQVITDLKLFLGAAIGRQDLPALRGFYSALGDKPELQERIALISDALGYGFLGGDLGIDLETRLTGKGKTKARAQRDVFIALAMGATLSDIAEADFSLAGAGEGKTVSPGALAALQAAAQSNSKAETALRAADILSGDPLDNPSLYAVIKALSDAGLPSFAGRLAAKDFLRAVPG